LLAWPLDPVQRASHAQAATVQHVRVDRQFWCEQCRTDARRLAARWGRSPRSPGAARLALWVGLVVQPPSTRLLVLYAGAVLAVYRIGRRLVEEVVFGVMRIRNKAGVHEPQPGAPEDGKSG